MKKVSIQTAGHCIEVEDDTSTVQELADLAEGLWTRTRDPKLDRSWGATGFSNEKAPGPIYEPDLDAILRSGK